MAGDNTIRSPRYDRGTNTPVTMYDEEGDGWWLDNYLGSSWYLADKSRTQLFHTGTLCDGTSGYCNMCLLDGDYTMRFTGLDGSNFTSWDFCGVTGSYGQELIFEVEDGRCVPIAVLTVDAVCNDPTITYTLQSSVTLCLAEEYLNLTDTTAVTALTQTLIELLGADDAMIVMEEEGGPSRPSRPSRGSRSSTDDDKRRQRSSGKDDDKEVVVYRHEIEFQVVFTVHSDELEDEEALEQKYEELLEAKIANGTFVSTLRANGLLSGYLPYNFTSCADATEEFELVSAVFDNATPLTVSPLSLVGEGLLGDASAAVHVVSSYDYSSITLFFGAILLGFVAFVGILARGMTSGYDSLGDHSEHLDLSATGGAATSRHGLINGEIEMDHTISNPLGRNAAHEVDLTRVSQAL